MKPEKEIEQRIHAAVQANELKWTLFLMNERERYQQRALELQAAVYDERLKNQNAMSRLVNIGLGIVLAAGAALGLLSRIK